MLLPRRRHDSLYIIPSLLGLVTVIFLFGEIAIISTNAQNYNDGPPRYNYDRLPKTSFSCKGRLPGRYYPDPETDCQMFHVCVKMTNRDVQDFKFLCPNGTVFDSEHQVCIDYYQVVCHTGVGTNPLGQIFEIFKLSSGFANRGLDAEKLSFVNPDSVEKNTLGDDFQVEENNNNRLASAQNSLNFRSSDPAPSPRPTKSQKAKEDIFFSNKGFVPSTFNHAPSTTRRTTTTTTTTTTETPSSSTPRRPSLETFESYETESFSGFIPTRNSFNNFGRAQDPSPDFDASTEDFAPRENPNDRVRTTKVSTTARPYVFQNTFRTTLSHIPSTSRPSAQTFQQQATRFNDEYFTRIPSTTRRPVSKAAQFFVHSTMADDYFTPEYRQSTENPFLVNHRRSHTTTTTSTTIRPHVVFQANSGTRRPKGNPNPTTDFQYQTTTTAPPTTTQTTTTETPTTTEYFGRYRQTEDDFEAKQTTYSGFIPTTRNSNFFNVNNQEKQRKDEEFGGKTSSPRKFPPPLSSQYVEEETLRPRNINGVSNAQNILNGQPPAEIRPRDNFGFSTVPPPTTAEPFSTPPPTTASSAVTQQETAQTLAARLQGQLFKKITTTKNPEKYSIFFGRSTQSVGDDRLPAPGPTTVLYYDNKSTTTRPRSVRVRSTTANPLEQPQTSEPVYDRRGRLSRFNSASSTVAPDQTTPSSSQRPLRRGVRRRVRPANRPAGEVKNFDPQLKYTRRRFESGRVNKEGHETGQQKTDEIFNAEASVFRGDPSINNFYQEQRKGANSGSQKTNDKIDQAQQEQPNRQAVNQFEQFYGRRVRPNGGGDVQQNNNGRNHNSGEGPRRPPLPPGSQGQIRRRVVKRLRPKNGTVTSNQPEGASNGKQFVVTGSTLRPVTRINVKTKLGGKISTTYRTTEITDGSPSPTQSSSTTTAEPELVTASDDVVEEKRQRNYQTSSSTTNPTSEPFTKKPFPANNLGNDSHLVIKVISEKPFSPSPSFPTSPLSIKKPILSTPGKKFGKPAPGAARKNSSKSSNFDQENQTKSPDYDYAYYNSDDSTDYDAETSNLDHKNYGKKPTN